MSDDKMTKIKLQRTKVQTNKGLEPGVKALNNHALFEHCAGGRFAITEQYFDEAVEYLLRVHGIDKIEIIEDEI